MEVSIFVHTVALVHTMFTAHQFVRNMTWEKLLLLEADYITATNTGTGSIEGSTTYDLQCVVSLMQRFLSVVILRSKDLHREVKTLAGYLSKLRDESLEEVKKTYPTDRKRQDFTKTCYCMCCTYGRCKVCPACILHSQSRSLAKLGAPSPATLKRFRCTNTACQNQAHAKTRWYNVETGVANNLLILDARATVTNRTVTAGRDKRVTVSPASEHDLLDYFADRPRDDYVNLRCSYLNKVAPVESIHGVRARILRSITNLRQTRDIAEFLETLRISSYEVKLGFQSHNMGRRILDRFVSELRDLVQVAVIGLPQGDEYAKWLYAGIVLGVTFDEWEAKEIGDFGPGLTDRNFCYDGSRSQRTVAVANSDGIFDEVSVLELYPPPPEEYTPCRNAFLAFDEDNALSWDDVDEVILEQYVRDRDEANAATEQARREGKKGKKGKKEASVLLKAAPKLMKVSMQSRTHVK